MHTLNSEDLTVSETIFGWWRSLPAPVPYVWVVAIYLVCWAVLDKVALAFETAPEVSVWYPPSALDFVLLLVFGLHYTPALFLNTLVHSYVVTDRHLNISTLLIFDAVKTVGYAGASALLLYKLQINPRLRTFRDAAWFVSIAALAAPLIVAWLQVLNFASSGVIPWSKWWPYTLHYWAGDSTGIAMLAPFLLIWLRKVPWIWWQREQELPTLAAELRWFTRREFPELLAEMATLALAIWVAYGVRQGPDLDYSYYVFLPLIWIAVRHGLERVALTVLFINFGAAILVHSYIGKSSILALQFGMMAVSHTGLLLGAIATDRKQAEAALRYSARRLKILHKLDQRILTTRSLSEIAQVALYQMQRLTPCQRSSIVMFDFEAHEFTVFALLLNGEIQLEPGVVLPLEAFGDISALQQGEVSIVQSTFSGSAPAASDILGEGVRAYINVPLRVQNELIGSLNLGKDRYGTFESLLIDVACQVASQLAIAIQQARLFSKVEQQATRERSLNQISHALNSSLDSQQILQRIVQLAGEYFSVDRVILFTSAAEQISVLNEWRASDQVVSLSGFQAPLSECLPIYNFYNRQACHVPDLSQLSLTATPSQIHQTQLLSVLSVPIFVRDQLSGGLSLQTTTTKRTFTSDELQLLQAIAEQAALALYNAQSYKLLEQLVQERTKELEQEKLLSETANIAKSEFLSNMSHELRTPLTGILGFSSVLLEQIFGPLNAKQKEYIEAVSASGKHLLELINDLLDFSKIEAGREELTLEVFSVKEVASACMSLIQERADARGLQLSLFIAPNVTTCIADKRRLKQILFNLLSNAVKFTESGEVSLMIEQTEELKFSVIDTGIGIAQEQQQRLFEPFQQIDSGLARKYEGTGLGLALSRKLARLHGGDITVQSELGSGSCFTLHLPQREQVVSTIK